MKKRITIFAPFILLFLSYFMFSYTTETLNMNGEVVSSIISDEIEIPNDVQEVLKEKCYGCHNTESKGEKSKKKFNIDHLTDGKYSKGKLVSKLGKVVEDLEENNMPPEKFLAKYPNKELTAEESKLLMEWAKSQREVLVGE